MAEFHMLPSLKTESEQIGTTGRHPGNDDNSDESYDDEYEQWLIQNWDVWNEQAIQRTLDQSLITTATMPSLDHLTYQDYQEVYEPSDDTYLLLDAIQYDLSTTMHPNLQHTNDTRNQNNIFNDDDDDHADAIPSDTSNATTKAMTPICLEIGCGSGVVSVYFRSYWLQLQKQQQRLVTEKKNDTPPSLLLSYVTDINPKALQITYRTFQQAMKCARDDDDDNAAVSGTFDISTMDQSIGQVEYILCDIATPLLQRLHHRVTYIICNPPYVPTCDSEIGHSDITAAYAGGENGRRIIDRIVPQIIQLLDTTTTNGIAYLVTVDENLPLQLAIQMYRQQQQQLVPPLSTPRVVLQMKPFFRKRTKNEFLTIQKITYIDRRGMKNEL